MKGGGHDPAVSTVAFPLCGHLKGSPALGRVAVGLIRIVASHDGRIRDLSADGVCALVRARANQETATIATVGTAGATTAGAATEVGATVIPVAGAIGFRADQAISIDSGANHETRRSSSPQRAAGVALESPSPRRSLLRTRLAHKSRPAASPSPPHSPWRMPAGPRWPATFQRPGHRTNIPGKPN